MGRMILLAAVTAITALAGCASSNRGDVYSRGEARREQTVRLATVESVRPVMIEGTRTPIGAVAGGAVGGIAGSGVGHGRGSSIAGVLGAVGGGLAGAALEEGVTRKQGVEITVRLENGELRAIVQEESDKLVAGQKVRLLTSGGVTRVSP
jgi:outer membrane lipoprotein SlyB